MSFDLWKSKTFFYPETKAPVSSHASETKAPVSSHASETEAPVSIHASETKAPVSSHASVCETDTVRANVIFINSHRNHPAIIKKRPDQKLTEDKKWTQTLKNSQDEYIKRVIRNAEEYSKKKSIRSWEDRFKSTSLLDCVTFVGNYDVNSYVFTREETEMCVFIKAVMLEIPWFKESVQSLCDDFANVLAPQRTV
jgi:hypothetical protein